MFFCFIATERPKLVPCTSSHIDWPQCQDCKDYQAGKTKPAYPVPAIPYVAVIHVEGSYIWRTTLNGYILERECM